jgi:hypothetical protein
MQTHNIEQIDAAIGERGCGLICKFFNRTIEYKKPTPIFVDSKPYLILGIGNLYIGTGLWGEHLTKPIQALISKGVLEIRAASGDAAPYYAYYHFNVTALKDALKKLNYVN